MTQRFEYLDSDSFPDVVDVWRFDQDARVENGIKTARTILAERIGKAAMHGYFNEDVAHHIRSNYQSRLDTPSQSDAGVGSPFISGMLKPSELMLDSMIKRGDLDVSSLYRLTIPRGRIIVPRIFGAQMFDNRVQLDWKKHAIEVLVVGDVMPEDIEKVSSAKYFEDVSLRSQSRPNRGSQEKLQEYRSPSSTTIAQLSSNISISGR